MPRQVLFRVFYSARYWVPSVVVTSFDGRSIVEDALNFGWRAVGAVGTEDAGWDTGDGDAAERRGVAAPLAVFTPPSAILAAAVPIPKKPRIEERKSNQCR